MRAIEFRVTVPGYLLARSLGRWSEVATFGPLGGLRLLDRADSALPGARWARLEVLACGICGTDLGTITSEASPILEPFASFPAVPGHEILARVLEVGPGVDRVRPGDRVVVDPMLSCEVRGADDDATCPSCRAGRAATCERAGEAGPLVLDGGPLRPGMTIGYHADLPGGWGERMIAHETQLFPVDASLPDRTAVLVEPLAIAVHAVLNAPPPPKSEVLVVGSGPIALATVWALRAIGFDGTILAQMKRAPEAALARTLGADGIVAPGEEARAALIERGARPYRPILGPEVFAGGGFPQVYDCVGSAASLGEALRYAAPRARVVMLGCAAQVRRLDLTLLWARELEVRGFVGYGRERWRGEVRHTFEVTLELLREGRAPVHDMVTHVFPLREYRAALSAAANRRRSGALKVVLTPGDGPLG